MIGIQRYFSYPCLPDLCFEHLKTLSRVFVFKICMTGGPTTLRVQKSKKSCKWKRKLVKEAIVSYGYRLG